MTSLLEQAVRTAGPDAVLSALSADEKSALRYLDIKTTPESHFPAVVRFQGLILASTFPPEVCKTPRSKLKTFWRNMSFCRSKGIEHAGSGSV